MADVINAAANIGFKAYLSAFGTAPVLADLLGDIKSITGVGVTVNTVDATTISSPDGITRPAPTTKTIKPITVTLFKNNEGYAVIESYVLDKKTTDATFFSRLSIEYPKVVGVNDTVSDYSYDGFISELNLGDADAGDVQTISFVFTPTRKPVDFAGITP